MNFKIKLSSLLIISSIFLCLLIMSFAVFNSLGVNQTNINIEIEKKNKNIKESALLAKYNIVQIQQFLTDASLTEDEDSFKEAKKNLDELKKNLDKIIELDPSLKEMIDRITNSGEKLYSVGLEMANAYLKVGKAEGNSIMKRPENGFDSRAEYLAKDVDNLFNTISQNEDKTQKKLEIQTTNLQIKTIIFSIFELILTPLILYFIYRRTKNIKYTAEQLEKNVDSLGEVSESISSTSNKLAALSTEQASQIETTASSLEEIKAMIQNNFKNSERLKLNAETSKDSIENGHQALILVQNSISNINSKNQETIKFYDKNNQEIAKIHNIISEIFSKTKIIDEIVFQTKILSFNASIEAARAGEHGKGFAVVAEEIGNLANMSGNASKEISAILESATQQVSLIIESSQNLINKIISENTEKIKEAIETSNLSSQSFEQIISKILEENQLVSEIFHALEEQSKGIEEITKALNTLEKAAHENSSFSDFSYKISQTLTEQIKLLKDSKNALNKVVQGK